MEELRFSLLIEEMKKIYRQTKIIGEDRRENDAEHSYHIATMAIFLQEKSKLKVDIGRVVQILLIHDLVEIFAGDTFAYDQTRLESQYDREKSSLEKLQEYLSEENAEILQNLWDEFEAGESNEAKYARAMDRLQPFMSNMVRNDGGTWYENGVKLSLVLDRLLPIKEFNQDIYEFVKQQAFEATEKGFLINDIKEEIDV